MISSRRLSHAAVAVAGAALLLASGQAIQARQDASARRSIWSGVYTEAQAERGQVQYLQSCAVCHRDDLRGDSAEEVPGLATDEFLQGWNGRTVRDLVETLRRTMPGDRPGSLSVEAYVDIVAFILRSNKLPNGRAPLAFDLASLEPILIESTPR